MGKNNIIPGDITWLVITAASSASQLVSEAGRGMDGGGPVIGRRRCSLTGGAGSSLMTNKSCFFGHARVYRHNTDHTVAPMFALSSLSPGK